MKFQDLILRGATGARPTAGIAGRLFYDTTEQKLYRDSGSTWEDVEGVGGSGTNHIPTGGNDGQLLAKDGATNYALKFIDAPSGAEIVDLTYAQLADAIDGMTLVPGALYRITDYRTTHLIVDGGDSVYYMPVAQVDRFYPVGTSGTANITHAGELTKLMSFNSDIATTISNFVTAHAAAYAVAGIGISAEPEYVAFEALVPGVPFEHPRVVNLTGDLCLGDPATDVISFEGNYGTIDITIRGVTRAISVTTGDWENAVTDFVTDNAAAYAAVGIALTDGAPTTPGVFAALSTSQDEDVDTSAVVTEGNVSFSIVHDVTRELFWQISAVNDIPPVIGPVEPLIVRAISENQLAPQAFSADYPEDIIHYDWNPLNFLNDAAFAGACDVRDVVLTGTNGTLELSAGWPVQVTGVASFSNDIPQTYADFVEDYAADFLAENIVVEVAVNDDGETVLRFRVTSLLAFIGEGVGGNPLTGDLVIDGATTPTLSPAVVPGFRGVITFRYDTRNDNYAGFDWRNCRFRRWRVSGTEWSSQVYVAGSIVYYDSRIWIALVETSTDAPGTTSEWAAILELYTDAVYQAPSASWKGLAVNNDWQDFPMFVPVAGSIIMGNHFETSLPTEEGATRLDNNVFAADEARAVTFNTFGPGCRNNTFVLEMLDNQVGASCSGNIIGGGFSNNVAGQGMDGNLIGAGCNGNTFGNLFSDNIVGVSAERNDFGNAILNCIFGESLAFCVIGSGQARSEVGSVLAHAIIEPAALIDAFITMNDIYDKSYSQTIYFDATLGACVMWYASGAIQFSQLGPTS
jgi:hypothetical protein